MKSLRDKIISTAIFPWLANKDVRCTVADETYGKIRRIRQIFPCHYFLADDFADLLLGDATKANKKD